MCAPQRDPSDHRRHAANAGRRLHGGQQLDEGQRHGDHERSRAGARDPDRPGGRASRHGRRASCKAQDGAVVTDDGRRLGFGELVGDNLTSAYALTDNRSSRTRQRIRSSASRWQRVDIPAKVTGGAAYVQDLRLPGMVHARVVRPPSYGARLRDAADRQRRKDARRAQGRARRQLRRGRRRARVRGDPGDARACRRRTLGRAGRRFPTRPISTSYLQRLPADVIIDLDRRSRRASPGARSIEASYRRPYQMHGAIGPSCAVGLFKDGTLTVWTHSQGVYPLRKSIAEMLRLPEDRVRCIHVEGSGCYGHNAADDAGADAALIARAFPGRPVRVQWMREQEHLWEPYGPAMLTTAQGSARQRRQHRRVGLRGDRSNTHSTRPGGAGNLLPAWHLADAVHAAGAEADSASRGRRRPQRDSLLPLPNARVVHHFVPAMPIRVSALRALGAYMNVFSIESFMDELAQAAASRSGRFSPAPSGRSARARRRLARGRTLRLVVVRTRSRARPRLRVRPIQESGGVCRARARGRGRSRDGAACVCVRAVAAVDSGQAVNPDGIRNQIEGGIIQSTSWTLHEAVTFDRTAITSADWSRYPILRFPEIPESVDVHVIDRPGAAFPRHRRSGAGTDGGGDRQRHRRRDRREDPRAAADSQAGQGGDRRVDRGKRWP